MVIVAAVESFKYPKRGREVKRGKSRVVRSEIKAFAGDVVVGAGAGYFVAGVEAQTRDRVLRVIYLILMG